MKNSVVKTREVVMLGPSPDAPGGVSAVVRTYLASGLVKDWGIRYVSTYTRGAASAQVHNVSRALLSILPALVARRVALMHVHSASRGSFWRKSLFCLLASLFRVPYVFHIHSGEFVQFFNHECNAAGRRYIRWVLERARAVIVLTPSWKLQLEDVAPRACINVLANPVHVPALKRDSAKSSKTVLFLGRLRQKKGVYDLLEAAVRILETHPKTRFILAGDGELDQVRRRSVELGIEASIELPGWVDGVDKTCLLDSADLLVLPSYAEGLPVCILEGFAHGVPVVATRVGGIPDVINHGRNGWLVDPGNVEQLADAITRTLKDVALRQTMRQSGYDVAKSSYCVSSVSQSLGTIYEKCGVNQVMSFPTA